MELAESNTSSTAAWKDMASISLKECDDAADGQKWVVMADGRIALELSSPRKHSPNGKLKNISIIPVLISQKTEECIDLQYMRATANNPVGLYSCAGLGNIGAADKGINWPLVNVTEAA